MALLLVPLVLSSCGVVQRAQAPAVVQQLSQLVYPSQTELGDDLDIIVVRDRKGFRLVNRTAHSYQNLYLWLNQQYVANVERIEIGTANRYQLFHWINSHGEPFPVGWFLAPDEDRPIVHAELYDPTTRLRYRLVVRLDNIS